MPITADWLFQNHPAQQVTIQLLARALSSTEDAAPNLNDAAEIEALALARPPLDGMPHTPTQGSHTERVVLQRAEQEKQEAMRQKLQKYLWYQQLYDALLKTFTLRQYRTNELVRWRMHFLSDAIAEIEGLLEVNRDFCKKQMAEKASPALPTNCAVVP